jgi:hypothetical protein
LKKIRKSWTLCKVLGSLVGKSLSLENQKAKGKNQISKIRCGAAAHSFCLLI